MTFKKDVESVKRCYVDRRNPHKWSVEVKKGRSEVYIEFGEPIMYGGGEYGLEASWGHVVPFNKTRASPHAGVLEALSKAPTMISVDVERAEAHSAYARAHNIKGYDALSGGGAGDDAGDSGAVREGDLGVQAGGGGHLPESPEGWRFQV